MLNPGCAWPADAKGLKRGHSGDSGVGKRARSVIAASPVPVTGKASVSALLPSAAEYLEQMLKQAQLLKQSGGEPYQNVPFKHRGLAHMCCQVLIPWMRVGKSRAHIGYNIHSR